MQKFTTVTAKAIPLGVANVDTDIIIPAAYLKAITRKGLGRGAFANIRTNNPDSVFDKPEYQGAEILIAGDNFGCGSSREHAPWALMDMGLKAIIAESFADIFSSNSFKNGLLLVRLTADEIDRLMEVAREGKEITVDLENQTVTTPYQDRFKFEIDPFRKHCLLNGLDEISLTDAMNADIVRHEARLNSERPWISGAAGVAA